MLLRQYTDPNPQQKKMSSISMDFYFYLDRHLCKSTQIFSFNHMPKKMSAEAICTVLNDMNV